MIAVRFRTVSTLNFGAVFLAKVVFLRSDRDHLLMYPHIFFGLNENDYQQKD